MPTKWKMFFRKMKKLFTFLKSQLCTPLWLVNRKVENVSSVKRWLLKLFLMLLCVHSFKIYYLFTSCSCSFQGFFFFFLKWFFDFLVYSHLYKLLNSIYFFIVVYILVRFIRISDCNLYGFCDISSIVLKYLLHWYCNPHIEPLFLVYTMKLYCSFY